MKPNYSDITHVAVDADQMVYACGFAANDEPAHHAYYLLAKKLKQIAKVCGVDNDDLSVFIQGSSNYREDIAFDYKAHRKADKPVHFVAMRQYLINKWGAEVVEHMETDDWVSILTYQDQEHTCVASPDKDLNNTPGFHYNYQKDKLYYVTERQAHRHLWYQMLAGDRADNIKGLPYCTGAVRTAYSLSAAAAKGCGDGSAKKIMESVDFDYGNDDQNAAAVEQMVHDCYMEWGTAEGMDKDEVDAYMLQQYQLLYMCREVQEEDDTLPVVPDRLP